jgi:hypothetical protein
MLDKNIKYRCNHVILLRMTTPPLFFVRKYCTLTVECNSNGVSPDCLGVLLGAGIMAFPLGEQETGKTGGFLSRLVDVLSRKPGKLVFHSIQ